MKKIKPEDFFDDMDDISIKQLDEQNCDNSIENDEFDENEDNEDNENNCEDMLIVKQAEEEINLQNILTQAQKENLEKFNVKLDVFKKIKSTTEKVFTKKITIITVSFALIFTIFISAFCYAPNYIKVLNTFKTAPQNAPVSFNNLSDVFYISSSNSDKNYLSYSTPAGLTQVLRCYNINKIHDIDVKQLEKADISLLDLNPLHSFLAFENNDKDFLNPIYLNVYSKDKIDYLSIEKHDQSGEIIFKTDCIITDSQCSLLKSLKSNAQTTINSIGIVNSALSWGISRCNKEQGTINDLNEEDKYIICGYLTTLIYTGQNGYYSTVNENVGFSKKHFFETYNMIFPDGIIDKEFKNEYINIGQVTERLEIDLNYFSDLKNEIPNFGSPQSSGKVNAKPIQSHNGTTFTINSNDIDATHVYDPFSLINIYTAKVCYIPINESPSKSEPWSFYINPAETTFVKSSPINNNVDNEIESEIYPIISLSKINQNCLSQYNFSINPYLEEDAEKSNCAFAGDNIITFGTKNPESAAENYSTFFYIVQANAKTGEIIKTAKSDMYGLSFVKLKYNPEDNSFFAVFKSSDNQFVFYNSRDNSFKKINGFSFYNAVSKDFNVAFTQGGDLELFYIENCSISDGGNFFSLCIDLYYYYNTNDTRLCYLFDVKNQQVTCLKDYRNLSFLENRLFAAKKNNTTVEILNTTTKKPEKELENINLDGCSSTGNFALLSNSSNSTFSSIQEKNLTLFNLSDFESFKINIPFVSSSYKMLSVKDDTITFACANQQSFAVISYNTTTKQTKTLFLNTFLSKELSLYAAGDISFKNSDVYYYPEGDTRNGMSKYKACIKISLDK